MLAEDIKRYVDDSVARRGEGGAVTGLCGSINQMVRDAFRRSPVRFNSPRNLWEYVVNKVLDAKAAEGQVKLRRTTSASGIAYVLSVEPPLVRLEDGSRKPYVSRLPVAPGKTYTYYMSGNTVTLEGVFEGAITRPRDYPVDVETLEGFLMHPRTGSLVSHGFLKTEGSGMYALEIYEYHTIVNSPGYNAKHELLSVEASGFPMFDEDLGTKNLKREWEVDEEIEADYGNLDWRSANEDPDKVRILSFKGPPGRHLPLNPTMDIPGLTVFDEAVNEVSYFTPFSKNIYEGGEILEEAPDKVLGCALCGDWLIAICGENRRPNGFWNVVYAKRNSGDWVKLSEFSGSRPSLPWFFNQSGTQAVNRGSLITIDPEAGTAEQQTLSYGSGEYKISKEFWSAHAAGYWDTIREFKGDELVTLSNSLTGFDTSTFPSDNDFRDDQLLVYFEGKFAKAVTILGTDTPTVGAQYSYQLSDGDVTCGVPVWTMSGGTINQSGTVLSITGCGMGSISLSFSEQGPTATKQIRLPTGAWILMSEDHTVPYTCGWSAGNGMYVCWGTFEKVIDNVRIVQYGNTTNLDTVCPSYCLPSELGLFYEYESCASDGGGRIHTTYPLKMCYVMAIYRYRWGCP